MSKKKKYIDQAALWELTKASKKLKMKKKAIQFECVHKNKHGKLMLRSTSDPYVFKCKMCKDKKVDLGICNPANGTIEQQLKTSYRIVKSSFDLMKLQSSPKDSAIVATGADLMRRLYAYVKVAKKVLPRDNGKKKKWRRQGLNVTSGGRSVLH